MHCCKKFLLQTCLGLLCMYSFANAEEKMRPQDNFYQWVNHAWLESTSIPSDKPSINNFVEIQNSVNANTNRI